MITETGNRPQAEAVRTNTLLRRKMLYYLIPAMLTGAAFSLSEFVDSMIVANILDSESMGVVQLGSPVIFVCATIYVLLGRGGSTHYAISQGERDPDQAGRVFSVTFITSLVLGLLILLAGFVFFHPLSRLFCTDPALADRFDAYYSAMLYSVPFLITIMTLTSFLPAAGAPGLCTAVNVVANVVNVTMDYVYIRVFDMGVAGAAWATLTGYVCGAFILVYAIFSKKVGIRKTRPALKDFRMLPELLKTGGASGLTQFCYAVKFAFCNRLALRIGGVAGLIGITLVMQGISVVSIFLSAVVDASAPLLGMLQGQRDYRGQTSVLRRSLLLSLFFSGLCTLYFIIFPASFAWLYDAREGEYLAMALIALPVSSLLYLIRALTVPFTNYLQVIGRKIYAMLISLLDGVGLIIPLSLVMTSVFGINGLWWAFPVSGVFLLAFILIGNHVIAKKHPDRYTGLLLEQADEAPLLLDVSILDNNGDISRLSERVQRACEQSGVSPAVSVSAALLLEEMAVYLGNHANSRDYMDIMMRVYEDEVILNIRNIGPVVNPDRETEKDIRENMLILKKMSRVIDNSYIMGMNNVRIVLDRNPQSRCPAEGGTP